MLKTTTHFVKARPRLVIAFAFGIAVASLLPTGGAISRALAGWNTAVWSYLLLMAWMMVRAKHGDVRRLAEQEDENAVMVLTILSVAATVSIAAIVFELASAKSLEPGLRLLHYLSTGATLIGSWLLLAVIFTLHYARMFYGAGASHRSLKFPDDETQPDYWDFLYFSFTIAVAAQTSDVSVMSRAMRKAVLAQSVLSFFFNAAIIGFSINIAASLVSG